MDLEGSALSWFLSHEPTGLSLAIDIPTQQPQNSPITFVSHPEKIYKGEWNPKQPSHEFFQSPRSALSFFLIPFRAPTQVGAQSHPNEPQCMSHRQPQLHSIPQYSAIQTAHETSMVLHPFSSISP